MDDPTVSTFGSLDMSFNAGIMLTPGSAADTASATINKGMPPINV